MNISLDKLSLSSNMLKIGRKKFGVGSMVAGVLVGLLFCSIGLYFVTATQPGDGWQKTSGKIVGVSERRNSDGVRYSGMVQYEADGRAYTVTDTISSSSTPPTVGAMKEVYYNPVNPSEAKTEIEEAMKWTLWLMPLAGLAAIVASLVAYFVGRKRTQEIERLVREGTKLAGVLVDVKTPDVRVKSGDGVTSPNMITQYKLVVAAIDIGGSSRNYVSDWVSGPAGIVLANFQSKPIAIDVYVDPFDQDKYYVDLSDIPQLTPDRIAQMVKNASINNSSSFATQPPVDAPVPPTTNVFAPADLTPAAAPAAPVVEVAPAPAPAPSPTTPTPTPEATSADSVVPPVEQIPPRQ